MGALIWIGIGVGGLVLAYLLFVIVSVFITGIRGRIPTGIEVDTHMPAMVKEGEAFEIVLKLTDTSGNDRRLRSVDFDRSLAKGFAIESIKPAPRESAKTLGTVINSYDLGVAAGQSVELRFACRGVVVGDFEGDMTVYVDSAHSRYMTRQLRVVVKPAAS